LHLRPQLSAIRARFGYPYHKWMTQEFDDQGWNLVQKSLHQKRAHDVTLLIEGTDGRFALMSKHSYPPGVFRSPSGGVRPGEDLVAGAVREAKEETGLAVDIKRFLLHATLDLGHQGDVATWDSYVFHAVTADTRLRPTDLREVRDTRWAGREQMRLVAAKLRETGNGGLMYRGDLTEASIWALDNTLSLRQATPRDLPGIEKALIANHLDPADRENTYWWVGEVQGLSSATVGIKVHQDCAELVGLTVDHFFRGRGLGHAMVEYACDQWHDPEKRKRLSGTSRVILNDKLWVLAHSPGYFLPVGFVMSERELLPSSLKARLVGPRSRYVGMRHQVYKLG
jgi:8-oxo-dGTP pyrophosphatase MutT (NUDIX family)/N-acetylglutamate synthase-like GNAT family acetyltransferase